MTGYNSLLMTGYAQLFADEGLGFYSTTAVYPPDQVGIFVGLTPDQPDKAITIMTYPVADSDLTSVVTGLQVRFRGGRTTTEVEDMSDAVFNLLHNKQHYNVNGVHVDLSWRQSGAWMGQDSNQRVERVENFYLNAERTSPHQIP